MEANRKELALLRGKRTPETLEDWAKVFGEGDRQRAERYALAVATFIGNTPDGEWADYLGQLSPNTRTAYAFAVSEFFEWAALKHNRVVPPHKVTRKDAEDYINWLANRNFSLAEEKLKDGDMATKHELFEIVKKLQKANLSQIIEALPENLFKEFFQSTPRESAHKNDIVEVRASRRQLNYVVRELVTMDVLTATPTIAQLRADHPQAGITQFDINGKPIEDVFSYSVKVYAPVSRTTVALRLAALSTFWKILMQGENISGGEAILQYNIWDGVKRRVSRGLSQEKRAASRKQKVPTEVVLRMLEHAPGRTLVQLRDRAILYLMVFAGLRTTELLKLRRGNSGGAQKMPFFDGNEPPAIKVLRKGNKWMRIPYPPVALKPLIEFQQELDRKAVPTFAQFKHPNEEGFHQFGIGYYYRDLQLPDAPLFPSIALWGNNSKSDYRKSMSRVNLYKLLQKMAQEVGLSDDLVKQVHPHALRHFSANAMVSGGKDLREVQHILGHTSITTTEGYLEDVEDEVQLSGQGAILEFLKAQGVHVAPTYDGKQKPERHEPTVIDTYAIEAEFEPQVEAEPLLAVEVEVLNELSEFLPSNELPQLPAFEAPEVNVIDTADGDILEVGGELIGIGDDEDISQEMLDSITHTINKGESPGSPNEVYENLASGGEHETVVFNRSGQKDIDFINDHYPKMPKNFGVGRESLLPWYVKAQGNISKAGFFKGVPPFPVWAPEQADPETSKGKLFIRAIEEMYVEFMYGNPQEGIAPSPIRSIGLIKWFGFFAYNSRVFEKSFDYFFQADTPSWGPFSQTIPLGDLRMHKRSWLLDWMRDNAHTYRASADAMKREEFREASQEAGKLKSFEAKRDLETYFMRASFEGIDLLDKMPTWMVENDPIQALWYEDAAEFKKLIRWLKNVTGQNLTIDRKAERDAQESREEEAILKKAELVKQNLREAYKSRDRMESAKKTSGNSTLVVTLRDNMRNSFLAYLTNASNRKVITSAAEYTTLMKMGTTEYVKSMDALYEKYEVPNPNSKEYKAIRGTKQRITKIVQDIFPDEPLLASPNLFADSDLFDPRWFRIDEKNHTIYVEAEAAEELQSKFGIRQNVQLLLRRSARAMFEVREKGFDKMWGVMMSYFSWIVPTGAEMEHMVKGIPIKETGSKKDDIDARKQWLSDWVSDVKGLANGQEMRKILEDAKPGESKILDSRETELAQLEAEQFSDRARYGDALEYLSSTVDGLEYASMASSDAWSETPEDLLMEQEEYEDYAMNPKRRRAGLTKNGKSAYLHIEGEKPKGWYKVDLYGGRQDYERNAAPVTYMSPGIMYAAQKRVEPARLLLPSPFRMIAAMQQE